MSKRRWKMQRQIEFPFIIICCVEPAETYFLPACGTLEEAQAAAIEERKKNPGILIEIYEEVSKKRLIRRA